MSQRASWRNSAEAILSLIQKVHLDTSTVYVYVYCIASESGPDGRDGAKQAWREKKKNMCLQ